MPNATFPKSAQSRRAGSTFFHASPLYVMTVAEHADSLRIGRVAKMNLDHTLPVLVVDDFKPMSRILCLLLRQVGFREIDEAADGEEALARMKERQYGLIISDWHMQPVDGYQFLEQVRADDSFSGTPFIMVSAEASPEHVSAARKAGANAYVTKPFDAETLRERIELALQPGGIRKAA